MDVWVAEKCGSGPAEKLGLFSTLARAKGACQDSAGEYYGPAHTPPLRWAGRDDSCCASYAHPADGTFVFWITRFTVDQAR